MLQIILICLRRTILFMALLLSCSYSLMAHAALNLELTQGKNAALPIAVVPFAGQAAQSTLAAASGSNVAYIIQQDLQNSGQFYATAWSKMSQQPHAAAQFTPKYWQQLGVDDVLVGQVSALPAGRYKIHFALLAVYPTVKNANAANPSSNILLSQDIAVAAGQLRQAAHHISDVVYKNLLGTPGVFSTRIAYVNWYIGKRYDAASKSYQPRYRWGLQLADADGYAVKTLLTSPWPIMSPAWSPDGKQIAYVSFENNQAQVFLQQIASGRRQVISEAAGINGAPAFSPDGKSLALVLSLAGHSSIYIMRLPSGKPQPMMPAAMSVGCIDTEPTWAPDGKSVVFTSDRGGSPQLYQYDLTQPAQAPQRVTFSGNYNAHAAFLPNGKQLVLMHRDRGSSIFSIAKLNLSSGRLQPLTTDISSQAPSVAPNGQMVLYSTRYGNNTILGEVSINGDIKLRLPLQSDNSVQKVEVKDPAWSPFLSLGTN